jgi:hypothetical protein
VEAAALQDSESSGSGRHDEFMPLERMGPRAGAERRRGALEGSTSWDAERQIAKSAQGAEWDVAMHRDEVGRSGSLTPREVAARRGAACRGREDQHGQGLAIDAALGTRPKAEQPGGRAAALRHDLAGRSAQGEWRGERLPTRAEGDDDEEEEAQEEQEKEKEKEKEERAGDEGNGDGASGGASGGCPGAGTRRAGQGVALAQVALSRTGCDPVLSRAMGSARDGAACAAWGGDGEVSGDFVVSATRCASLPSAFATPAPVARNAHRARCSAVSRDHRAVPRATLK